MKNLIMLPLILNLFDGNTNITSDMGLSEEMKTYYSDYLIDMAEPKLVHDQFGQKHPIPKNGGKTIQFRKYSPLPKLLTNLQEGVTPDGQKLNMSVIEATVAQYGGYVELSDILLLTAIDNNLVQATKLLGSQAGRTLDTITREELAGGTNVQYGEEAVSARYLLKGGEASGNNYLTVDCIRRAVRNLKHMNAEKIDGSFVAIINPDCTYDLMKDPEWQKPHEYVDTENIYSGEIGKIAGCRFVESTEAKIIKGAGLSEGSAKLTVDTTGSDLAAKDGAGHDQFIKITETLTADEQAAIAGRKILINGVQYTVHSAKSANELYIQAPHGALDVSTLSDAEKKTIYPGEGGAKGRAVYTTLILADNAYGVTELSGGGLQHIVKQLGSGGTTDPLNQRATAGWKATKVAKRLVEEYMVRIETCSTYDSDAN